jgi:hypothetical protein
MRIDCKCDGIRKVGDLKRRDWCHLIGRDSLFQKTLIITPHKKKKFSQEKQFKAQLLSRGLKLPNSKIRL